MLGVVAIAVSGVLLVHAVFSAMQFEHWVKMSHLDRVPTSLPFDIIVESMLGLLMCVLGTVVHFGYFRNIKQARVHATKSDDERSRRPEFHHFNHRGRAGPDTKLAA
ncbi:Membrane magnesium transporter [Plasmodiophora brassicae]|uniref:Uncharacterized protein n=1 Tax=Plasmodiophora brassicae TaxID=37360 RepID=A0A0G4J584_PLABS|nr:hypothetical protein PBRA_002624 [Plasmodiophora brassicae]SPQ94784.1 unnamed protein product [Plasmodiophora brassicae]